MLLNWVEIDAQALRGNVAEFRRRIGAGPKFYPVVKSNAYGHGMVECASIVRDAGADGLCVNNLDEGIALRRAGHDAGILVLGYVPRDGAADAAAHDLEPVVYNDASIDAFGEAGRSMGRPVRVHLKLETGTNRQGVEEGRVPDVVRRILANDGLVLAGVYTHFANIEDTTDHNFAESQIAAFDRIVGVARAAGATGFLRHAACSAATVLFNRTHLDLVRVGISLYGLWSSRETYVSCLERGKPSLALRPVLSWKTRIAQVKSVPEGAYVGYGCTYRATRPMTLAVLPVGYHEGYDRGLSGVAHVLIRGKRAPVRGRVCMNMCMVDVTDVPGVAPEEEVVLLGAQGDEVVGAEQLASWCGTIAYETVTRIHPGLPRIVV